MNDPSLEALSRAATEEHAACPITLVVSGTMVTGHLVAQDAFEADTTRMVETAMEQTEDANEAVQAMGRMISAMLDAVDEPDGAFVHVSVQEVMTGAESIDLGGSVFRFRADEIQGYTIGTVETHAGQP
jgi:D-alanyl-D-alanine carboxypeptidase